MTSGTPIDIACLIEHGETIEALSELGGKLDEPYDKDGSVAHAIAREWLRIRNKVGENVPLEPNDVQREYERRRGERNLVLKARQMGISTWVTGRLFTKTITQPGTLTVQVAHTQEAAESLFRMVHRFRQHLPERLKNGVLKTSRSSVRQMIFPALDSEYRVESAAARNAGRGLTITNLHCSEVARWTGDAAETLQGLRAAMPPHGELVLESTPMGAGGCFWNEWQEAESTGMVRHFYPWWWEKSYVGPAVCETTLTDIERRLMSSHQLTHAQIGFRRQLIANFRGLAKQEYIEDANECFLSSGECVFEVEEIMKRERELQEPVNTRLNGQLLTWYPAIAGRRYLAAVDPAGGGSEGDYSAVQVLDIDTGMQCAELMARMGGYELANEVAKLATEYNHALVVVERNNMGSALLAYLSMVFRYTNIYEQNDQQGYLTNSVTRSPMIGLLGATLVEKPTSFSSRRFLKQCRTFVRHRSGKQAAQYGEHDDCVMAMAIGLQVRSDLQVTRLKDKSPVASPR
jgi:hypothetical protein